jgi:hypothetical protein
MQFHLIHRGLDAGIPQEKLEFRDCHVRSPYVANQPQVDQLLHLPPSFHEIAVDVGFRVFAARCYITPRWMEVRERPVHQVEIQIFEPQVGERLSTRSDHIIFAVFVVPQF